MADFRQIFENDWCGIDRFLGEVLSPVFGEYDKGYTTLPADNMEIRHAAKFDFYGSDLNVYDITVADRTLLERNRVGIQRTVRQYIQQFEGALLIFHHKDTANQEWRLSYVEKRTGAKDSTPAKRCTYILGRDRPAKTVSDRFASLAGRAGDLTLKDLTDAFSVEPLSKEFFDAYKAFYKDFVQYITGNRDVKVGGKYEKKAVGKENKAIFSQFKEQAGGDYGLACKLVRDYVKKLMGRLVFLHFLQKKGWLGVDEGKPWGSGDRNFIQNLFAKADDGVKDDFLSRALEPLFFRTLNTDRGKEALAPEEISTVYGRKVRIPYLNGGLFEEDELDKKRVRFRREDFKNLLDFFSRYNFTIDEGDPTDKEIGIDPEMLGKIFENLLEDNKDKGAFYTPKEIVQYMCRESLAAYLCADGDAGAVRRILERGDAEDMGEDEKSALLGRLHAVKVCDPAVGSGAFPMGMMNELFALRTALGDTEEPSEIKKQIVRDNIYGVDIEKGAVDIARLRFWLAIIVDEQEPIPLPNLDYKIMRGNSLLESVEGVDLSALTKDDGNFQFAADEINYLLELLKTYFDKHAEKEAIRDSIKAAVIDLVRNRGINASALEKLERITLHDNSDFFLWHTWFGDVFSRKDGRSGFDIVIGNPPYGAKTSDKEKELYKKYYEAAKSYKGVSKGSTDTFAVFVNLGYNLLAKNGNLAYIIPMAVTSSDAMTTLHNLLEKNCATIKVSSYSNRPKQIFDAACIRTSVFFFTKTLTMNRHIYTTKLQRRKYTDSIGAIIEGLVYIDSKELKLPGRYAKISLPIEKAILAKLFATGKNIADYVDEKGKPFYYRTSGGRYFNVISDAPTGSTQDKSYFVQKGLNSPIAAILSTSLFWFYCQVYTDGLHIKATEIDTFPLPDFTKVSSAKSAAIRAKYAEYLSNIERNVIRHATFKEYKLRKSKHLIDQLDDLICPLYGLTAEETEFIKNYEIEFRVEEEER